MQSSVQTVPVSRNTPTPWAGYVLSALAVLFLLVDGVIKVMNIAPVVEAQTLLGYPASLSPAIGILLLICLAVYLIPRTSVLGAILLTGYLGGAIASQVRIGAPLFNIVFPVIFGLLLWGGLYLRDDRLRTLIPLRS
jgi:hypothetical protein